MSPRVTYWTGIWEPHREALSKELEALRRRLCPRGPLVSFSAGQGSSMDLGRRVIRLSGSRYLTLRALGRVLEPAGDVTHAFGAIDCWHLLRAVGRRPTLLTVALGGTPLPGLYDRVGIFAVQAPVLADSLLRAGVAADRVTLIYPGIDVDGFHVTPPPTGRFTVVFASTPADAREFDDRGIPLMIEAVRGCPDIDLVLLWRQWGDLRAAEQRLARLRPPSNVIVRHGDVADIAAAYAHAHAAICCFAKNFGKTCPNSVMEALASGRPALVTSDVGLAGLVGGEGAGVVVPRTVADVRAGLELLRERYSEYQRRARLVADTYFRLDAAVRAYDALYRRLACSRADRRAAPIAPVAA